MIEDEKREISRIISTLGIFGVVSQNSATGSGNRSCFDEDEARQMFNYDPITNMFTIKEHFIAEAKDLLAKQVIYGSRKQPLYQIGKLFSD